jgi:hypothetical protein
MRSRMTQKDPPPLDRPAAAQLPAMHPLPRTHGSELAAGDRPPSGPSSRRRAGAAELADRGRGGISDFGIYGALQA